MKIYLLAFFFMTMGILTVMFMAASYGEKEMGLSQNILIPIILAVQFVGIIGAYSFAWLSVRIGNIRSLMIAVTAWIIICIGLYFVTEVVAFAIAAGAVGLVMGGSQALARSTYSKMIPETQDHTSFFSFYDVTEKLATVGGTFSFGVIEAITGSMRNSVFAIVGFFVIGLIFLTSLSKKRE
jgi:UMF1 family MFS transporter